MKVAIIHTDFRIYWPARLRALNNFLKERGISMEVIEIAGAGSPYAFADKEDNNGLMWHILFPERRMEELQPGNIKEVLYDKLSQINPDVLIAGAIAFPSGALSVSWAMKNKKRVICFDDAKMEAVKRSGMVNWIKKNIYNGVYAMLYPSPDWVDTGCFWGFKQEQMFYGIDVVDNEFWQDYSDGGVLWKKRYFLTVGRQVPKKNFLHTVISYKVYHDRFGTRALPLLMVGDGPEHGLIERYVKDNNLLESVTLLPFKSQKELRHIYHGAEALILSSNYEETWGLVINEAMACGVPVIASDQCGATHTLIRDGVNGYSFSLIEQDSLTKRMCEYHELSVEERNKMRLVALNTINEWGLPRFCQCCYDAINYVSDQPLKKFPLINKLIINLWNGRYRPI